MKTFSEFYVATQTYGHKVWEEQKQLLCVASAFTFQTFWNLIQKEAG